ncbi:hypothetical protein [Pseudoponticoccus marisrubri]|uniref:Uncharacterized protein n=1 Tax=Pseudoponticoccus marisrubri TaxID=1685382 RepID=A0A0W7WJC8_9RHOB|nr:hypothetical protein [Pseudoponticoccus marisrubri]KUF10725.1 hypothetical protein AVJ23_09780 [Pseudoponticoccus marisrubri]
MMLSMHSFKPLLIAVIFFSGLQTPTDAREVPDSLYELLEGMQLEIDSLEAVIDRVERDVRSGAVPSDDFWVLETDAGYQIITRDALTRAATTAATFLDLYLSTDPDTYASIADRLGVAVGRSVEDGNSGRVLGAMLSDILSSFQPILSQSGLMEAAIRSKLLERAESELDQLGLVYGDLRQRHEAAQDGYSVIDATIGAIADLPDTSEPGHPSFSSTTLRNCSSSSGKVQLTGGGSYWSGTYSNGYDLKDGTDPGGTLSFSYNVSDDSFSGEWAQPSVGREGVFYDISVGDDGKTLAISYKYEVTVRGDQSKVRGSMTREGYRSHDTITCSYGG